MEFVYHCVSPSAGYARLRNTCFSDVALALRPHKQLLIVDHTKDSLGVYRGSMSVNPAVREIRGLLNGFLFTTWSQKDGVYKPWIIHPVVGLDSW